MAADTAAIPFKKREAETAMVFGKFKSTNSGEKINPPPRPTMVRMSEVKKMIDSSKTRGIDPTQPNESRTLEILVTLSSTKFDHT